MRRALLALAVVLLTACGLDDPPMKSKPVHGTRSDATKSVRLFARMVGGSIRVGGAAVPLVDGELRYNRSAYEPIVAHRTDDDPSCERVELAHDIGRFRGRARNEWDVRVANDLSAAIDVRVGVGAASLDLTGVRIAELSASVDNGTLSVDLSGAILTSSHAVSLQTGTGELALRIPKNAAVRLRGNEQVGDVKVIGVPAVKGEKGVWQTDDFESATTRLDIGFRVGIGQATIER